MITVTKKIDGVSSGTVMWKNCATRPAPGHGRDHVMPAFVPPYATVPVLSGRMALGTWQSVCLVDTNVDNPARTVRLSFLAG